MKIIDKKNLVAISSSAGGIIGYIFAPFVYSHFCNYCVNDIFSYYMFLGMYGMSGYIFGAYIGSILPWLFLKEEQGYIPVLLFWYTILGGVVYVIALIVLSPFIYALRINYLFDIFVVRLILLFLSSFVFARIVYSKKTELPKTKTKRFILAALGLVVFGLLPLLALRSYSRVAKVLESEFPCGTVEKSDFPVNGTVEERNEWGIKEFPNKYPLAVEFIKNANAIKKDVGDNMTVAPDINAQNYSVVGIGDPGYTKLTLEVTGEKSSGVCEMRLIDRHFGPNHEYKTFVEDVYWTFNGRKAPLNDQGSVDQQKLEYTEEANRKDEAAIILNKLYKDKKYQEYIIEAKKSDMGTGIYDDKTFEITRRLAESYEKTGNKIEAADKYGFLAGYLQFNNPKQAKQYVDRALKLNPNSKFLRCVLKQIEEKKK